MAGRPKARVPKAAIDRRRAVIAAAIAALGPPLPGSLVERRTTCGNKGCRCHADPPQLHGPYLTWTRKVDNKTVPAPGHRPRGRARIWRTPDDYANSPPNSRSLHSSTSDTT